ncbi:MAG: hypothetical protein HC836_48790 [Richelia sp. RM2_1_2]|nr:hypothetical protein [Rivularia sp. T60_A2020_040]NJN09113.1 hypothetical protein [Richelia sp. RM1_1_1]NJO65700.1 hypothetical protein [Richelia sp. RM2_1_2]
MIDPISLTLIFFAGAAASAAVASFWKDIKAWAAQAIGYIIDTIDWAVEVTSDAYAYVVKEGTRIYKRSEVFVRNLITGATRTQYRREEISRYDIPDEAREDLDRKGKLLAAQYSIS